MAKTKHQELRSNGKINVSIVVTPEERFLMDEEVKAWKEANGLPITRSDFVMELIRKEKKRREGGYVSIPKVTYLELMNINYQKDQIDQLLGTV